MRNQSIVDYLRGQGLKVIEEDIESKIDLWNSWYIGEVNSVHNYNVYEGKKKIPVKLKSLKMGARVCQDWADLLLNERVQITCADEYTQSVLARLIKQSNFYVRGNNLIETAFAKGGGFFVEYWDGSKTSIKYLTQDLCYPISYDGSRLTEVAFASKKTIAGKKYTYLETHLIDPQTGYYVIDNVLLSSDGKRLKEVDESFYEEHNLIPKVITQSTEPLFQMIRPNVANKEDFDSVFGTSVFADALDVLECVDIAYDAHPREIRLGKKRLFAKDSVTNVHINPETGEETRVFDANDEAFYLIKGDTEDGTPPIIECNMSLRIAELNLELQTQLDILSQKCGFGNNYYRWDSGSITTATEVISTNSKMFRTLKKHELVLDDAIVTMARGLLYTEALFTGDKRIKYDESITVDFDDSIIEDTAEIKRQASSEYAMGIISQTEYVKKVYKYDDEQASNFIKKMKEQRAAELASEPIQNEPEGA